MRKLTSIAATLVLMAFALPSLACTNYIITKGASTDGSVMISYSADSHVLYGELYHWNAGTWPAGTLLDIYEWDTGEYLGKIEQAPITYNVIGNINEFQLSIGETTYGGRPELGSQPGAVMDYGSLIYVTLQRAKNAREAIAIMAGLVEKYGYYSSGESFSIADAQEAWIMEMIGKGKEIRVDMKKLQKESVEVRNALKLLKDKIFYSDEAFLEALEKVAGKDFSVTYGKSLISDRKSVV